MFKTFIFGQNAVSYSPPSSADDVVAFKGPVEWTPSSAYTKMFSVNVLGMAMVTKSVLPLIRRAQGRIVNVASVAGRMGLPVTTLF